jgi:hypothetical protein
MPRLHDNRLLVHPSDDSHLVLGMIGDGVRIQRAGRTRQRRSYQQWSHDLYMIGMGDESDLFIIDRSLNGDPYGHNLEKLD